ncbi:MAG: putative alpha/beta superfamily hydrolase [Saprospiraceae bacterium]
MITFLYFCPEKVSQFDPIIEVIEEEYEIPHLNVKRKISALLPYDYHLSSKQYPVLYLQDGQNLFNPQAPYGDWAINKSLGKLAATGFKDIIIIAIDHGEQKRMLEYLPYDHPRFGKGKGKLYIRFMEEKLIPYVNSHYRTLSGYESVGIGGSSMGGLISLYAGLTEPEVFGKMMIFSPSLWISTEIFQQAKAFKALPSSRIYVYAGGKESQAHLPNVLQLESIFKKKLDKGAFFDMEVSVNHLGEHAEVYWREEFPKALKWLFFNNSI